MKKIISISILLFLISCSQREKTVEKSDSTNKSIVKLTEAQSKNAGVLIGKIEKRNISSTLRLNGEVDVPPQNKVSVSVPLGGYLKETTLLPGMHIAKGEVIGIMEDPQYIELQQDFLTAKAKLSFLEEEYIRQKELNQSKASSDKIFQQAQSDYTAQKVLVKSLSEKMRLINVNPETLSEANLSRGIKIFAPITGYVSKVNVNVGKYTKPEDVLFEVVNPEDIHLVLRVFEKDVNKLEIGQKVIVHTNSDPNKTYECEIILIGRGFLDDRSVEVHCHFKAYDKTLIPGMFLNAEIETLSESVYVLPSEAIVSSEGKNYIFASKGGGEFEMIEVKTGSSENGFTEVLTSEEDSKNWQIVVKGAYSLLMKMKNTEE